MKNIKNSFYLLSLMVLSLLCGCTTQNTQAGDKIQKLLEYHQKYIPQICELEKSSHSNNEKEIYKNMYDEINKEIGDEFTEEALNDYFTKYEIYVTDRLSKYDTNLNFKNKVQKKGTSEFVTVYFTDENNNNVEIEFIIQEDNNKISYLELIS